jgi:hypothetical protein
MESRDKEVGEVHHPDDDGELSTTILETIEAQKGESLHDADFHLYDDINPEALNDLFREDARGDTTVKFNTDDVTVTLWGDGAVAIKVTPRETD